MNCNTKILIESDLFYIAQCHQCKKISLQYKNILVKFLPKYFYGFCNALERIEFKTMSVLSPQGKRQIVLNTGHHDIQFTFTDCEFDELRDVLQQVKIMLDAEKLLQQPQA
ncbi:MAG: hypothetical protein MI975_04540 [Cytophagales bacterium]|nr:hypothetical protein [Cytophagales bacterium]